ncbi:acetyl-CoA carboxylase biotin carboxyl carrier protein subunit [Kitasatospora herbaricolor]|uniref:Acetyl-CoA carboxylase biotin carboxyl carrier protein subunit n=1 Tax=Kitasatospora herbaricolor TaxID=68217 RepID=A0ABZ1W5L9_9ACTN|nr:acetyl-CoA carboxylase biotin carboxyl carrier protein subunit [Kitasatospora herbaricolor]
MSVSTEVAGPRAGDAAATAGTTPSSAAPASAPRGAAVLEPGLDRPVGLVGARLWAAAAALLLVVGAGTGWALFGTLPHTLALPALLAHGKAPQTVRADRAGALLAYRVGPGQLVTRGQPLAVLRAADGTEVTVPAPEDGTITSLLSAPGAQLAPGAAVATLDAGEQPRTLRVFATTLKQAGQLSPGRTVLVPVPGKGVVRATITTVDPLPARADSLDGSFSVPLPGLPTGGAPVWTAYALLPDAESPSAGPVPLTVSVDLGARHPYQAVFGTGARR